MQSKLHYLYVWPFPAELSLADRTELLQQFGAVEVKNITRRGRQQASLAGFSSSPDCRLALSRLHQLRLLGNRRLNATLWDGKRQQEETTLPSDEDLIRLQKLEEQMRLGQPAAATAIVPPPHLRYKYPPPSASILNNICTALVAVPQLYTQLLHLMNKMNLPPPFGPALLPYTRLLGDSQSSVVEHTISTSDKRDTCVSNSDTKSQHKSHDESINAHNTDASSLTSDEVHAPCNDEPLQKESSSSESELESDSDGGCDLSKSCSISMEKARALKRPKPTGRAHQNLDAKKRVKLQVMQEKQHMALEPQKADKQNTILTIARAFKGRKGLGSSRKMQLNIPDTVAGAGPVAAGTARLAVGGEQRTDEGKAAQTTRASTTHAVDDVRVEGPSLAAAIDATPATACVASPAAANESASAADISATNGTTAANDDATASATSSNSGFGKLEAKNPQDVTLKIATSKFVSLEELEQNRVKESEYCLVPVLAQYQPGTPSCRLYIKNLARCTTAVHLHRIFDRYAHQHCAGQVPLLARLMDDPERYLIRVLQEGRMKGQAFVTLPTVELAQQARAETNGYILHDKPMVVAYARNKLS